MDPLTEALVRYTARKTERIVYDAENSTSYAEEIMNLLIIGGPRLTTLTLEQVNELIAADEAEHTDE